MEKLISDLLGIVREEIEIYRELIEHARRKTALLVQGSVEPLVESNKVDETFNLKLRVLESEMARLCGDLSQAWRIPREEFTLLKLADGLERSVAAEIKSLSSLFRNLVEQLKTVNQRNRRLVEGSIRYSRGLLDFLAGATTSYQVTGLLRPITAVQTTLSRRA
jgi:hypothetical protein